MATIEEVCSQALEEIGVVGAGKAMSPEDGAFALRKFNRIVNQWNAIRAAVYATSFSQFTLTPNLAPHTIGPTGATFTVDQRPVSIEGIGLGLTTSNPVAWLTLNKRDEAWWQQESVPDLTSDVPTDFFYNPTWPNGEINFWPVPSTAYLVQLQIRVLLTDDVALTDELDLPPGYEEALILTLAQQCSRGFGRPVTDDLRNAAGMARAAIFANNDRTPRLATLDSGMEGPGTSGMRPSFNWLIGSDSQ